MTTLREAAQQALEVLESGLLVSHHAQVLIDLRAALAQQDEPVQEPITRLFGTLPVHDAQQAEPVEPVAWMVYTLDVDALLKALKKADQFITNGIELGFIRMPDAETPDSAHETPGIVRAAIKAVEETK